MSDQVNVLAVAQRILDVPGGLEAVTRREVVALAGFVCQQNDDPRELRVDNPDAAALSASIAASIAIAISAFAGFGGARDARDAGEEADELSAWETFETAFNTLKTRFEKEFPNAGA